MKYLFAAFLLLLGSLQSNAQLPDTTAFKDQLYALRQRQVEIINQIKTAKASIRYLEKEYKNKSHDSSYTARMMYHLKERRRWKDEYRLWHKTDDEFNKKREDFNRSLLSYYKTQPFINYRNRSRVNQFLGVTMVSAGGLTILGGLINAMAESPGELSPATANREARERKIMTACTFIGGGLALASIPFFKAAHDNKVKFKNHIVWNVDLIRVGSPKGYETEVIGLKANIALFSR